MLDSLKNNKALYDISFGTVIVQIVGYLTGHAVVALKIFSNANPLAFAVSAVVIRPIHFFACKRIVNLNSDFIERAKVVLVSALNITFAVVHAGLYVSLATLSTDKLIALNLSILVVAIAVAKIAKPATSEQGGLLTEE